MSEPGRAVPARSAARPRLPAENAPFYTVGQVADLLHVQPAFLRRLESQQVVIPQRSAGGQRRYSRLEVDRISAITVLIGEGMTLAGAKRIIELQHEIDGLRQELADAAVPPDDGVGVDTGPDRR